MVSQIVILALSRVDSKYSSTALSLAAEYAKDNKVFYLNHPYTYKDFFKGGISGERKKRLLLNFLLWRTTVETTDNPNFLSVVAPLTLPINWISNRRLYAFFQSINDRIVQRTIRYLKRKHGLSSFVYHNIFDPFYLSDIKKVSGASIKIYHSVDDISQNAYTSKHGIELEKKVAADSDLVLVTSSELGQKFKEINPNTRVVHNAADFDLFNSVIAGDVQSELDSKKSTPDKTKVIGYTGNLDNNRIDYELIKKVAEENSKHQLVLVGPVNSSTFYELGLDSMPNVTSLGSRKIHELPQLLKDMDVVLIPFKQNKLTASIYPLKVNEYLAVGKSIVSTNFSRDIQSFSSVVKIADNHEEFLEKVREALGEEFDYDQYQQRIQTAKNNTWEKRLSEIFEHINETSDLV